MNTMPNDPSTTSASALARLFEDSYHCPPTAMAAAPGRIEFIGNHTDYNGGLVLGAAIDREVRVAVAPRHDSQVRLRSSTQRREVQAGLSPLERLGGEDAWANYPLGVLAVLQSEGMVVRHGFDLFVTSTVPAGAGLSSSAAFELATARALGELFDFRPPLERLVQLCRRAENEFVGMPCGILDQGVSGYGRRNHLVQIDCQTLHFQTVPMPEGIHFWIFNTNKKHNLVESLYAERHRQCMDAFAWLARTKPAARCLADFASAEVRLQQPLMPVLLYARALHVTEENERVKAMVPLIEEGRLTEAGSLLGASHRSSKLLFENSIPELDAFVELLTGRAEVWGARLTGGGFGGAVMAMTTGRFDDAQASAVAADFARRFDNCCPAIFHVLTADGARLLPISH